ncbi:hypothetical protein GOV14_06135 [Candidatus Pacearchaeota archaeon]|nr:hypothetical protein [Candidatus Pacearchaeota archaeon]
MVIDKKVEVDGEQVFDNKHIWVVIDGQKDWANKDAGGHGFIYRNFIGASKSKANALEQAYRKMDFIGGDFTLKNQTDCFVQYEGEVRNYYVSIMKYDLDGPSVFDMNH